MAAEPAADGDALVIGEPEVTVAVSDMPVVASGCPCVGVPVVFAVPGCPGAAVGGAIVSGALAPVDPVVGGVGIVGPGLDAPGVDVCASAGTDKAAMATAKSALTSFLLISTVTRNTLGSNLDPRHRLRAG